MGSPWDAHGNPMGTPWGSHGDAMGTPWGPHVDRMGSPWESMGTHGDPWGSHGVPWGPHGCPWGTHGIPMGMPWVPRGDAMGTTWGRDQKTDPIRSGLSETVPIPKTAVQSQKTGPNRSGPVLFFFPDVFSHTSLKGIFAACEISRLFVFGS